MGDASKKRGKYVVEVSPGVPATGNKPSQGPIFRNIVAQKEFAAVEGVTTLYELFDRSVKLHADNECLGWREGGQGPYVWSTYQAVGELVSNIASAMVNVGLGAHGRAGIYAVNCPEWMEVMQACNRLTVYTVPLYDTLGEEAVEFIVQKSESTIIFVSTTNWPKLLKSLPALKTQVQTVVYWGPDRVDEEAVTRLGIRVFPFKRFVEMGKEKPAQPIPPTASDLCTIMFTSGTTGVPKGVMITHDMMLRAIAALTTLIKQAPTVQTLTSQDSYLSYLPLAHVFDRVGEELFLLLGGKIGYYSGDVRRIVDDIAALRPTVFIGVPRVFDRIYAGVMEQITKAGGLKKFLFNFGYKRKLKALNNGASYQKASPFFDKLVFSKIKARLGGNVRIALSGAAPLAPHVEDFLRVALCCFFCQGYGLTETCAASFISTGEAGMQGTVGIPTGILETKLESIPEMKYDGAAEPPRGEICIRGPSVFKGYYKEPEQTSDVLDSEGWLHTGDVGEIQANGALKIIDRKKQIFKLSQGEYVAVERVESAYNRLNLIAQVFVYGNSLENVLVAVVVPEEKLFVEAANKEGVAGSFPDLVKNPKAKTFLLGKMDAVAKEGKLKGFEMVRGVILDSEQFSVENNLLTPTFKLKRPQLQAKYQSQIDALYAELKSKSK